MFNRDSKGRFAGEKGSLIDQKKIEKLLRSMEKVKHDIIYGLSPEEDLPHAHVLEHSTSGSRGVVAYALSLEGKGALRVIAMAEKYSDQGRILRDETPIPPEDYLKELKEGEILVLEGWDQYDQPLHAYSQWVVDISKSQISSLYTVRLPLELKEALIRVGASKVREILREFFSERKIQFEDGHLT
jgi:hypothetical protein